MGVVAGGIVTLMPIPLIVAAIGARRRRRLLLQPAERHLDQAREWLATRRIGPSRFNQLRDLLNPLARGTHPALGLRAGGGLLGGISFLVFLSASPILVYCVYAVAATYAAQAAFAQSLLPLAATLVLASSITGVLGIAISTAAGRTLRKARDAATDAMDEAAIEASHGPESVPARVKPALTAPGAVSPRKIGRS